MLGKKDMESHKRAIYNAVCAIAGAPNGHVFGLWAGHVRGTNVID